MKIISTFLLLLVIISCERKGKDDVVRKDTVDNIDSVDTGDSFDTGDSKETIIANKDTALLILSRSILSHIRNKNYSALSEYIHPVSGLRFSPYGYVDTINNKQFSAEQFVQMMSSGKKIHWGQFDGSGDSILFTPKEYFAKFVYDVDFLNAEKIAVNKILGHGNSLINISQIYRDSDFVEFHFSGFDKKYDGMDWRSLRLVFTLHNNKHYLTGIIHDQWTS